MEAPQANWSVLARARTACTRRPGLWLLALAAALCIKLIPPIQMSPQAAMPAALMAQVAALSGTGQTPKLTTAPLVQLDTSSKYYKTMIDGMTHNFKKAVTRASEKVYSLNNATTVRPINVVISPPAAGPTGGSPSAQQQQQRVSVQDLQIEGIGSPKVSNVHVNKKNMKLHVVFTYKTVRVLGRCSPAGAHKLAAGAAAPGGGSKVLLEATYWNASWSANVMQMVGREHFDMSRVYTSHAQQRLSLNLKECPQGAHDKLKAALLERVRAAIEARLVEVMEIVMMKTDASAAGADDFPPLAAQRPKERGKRASASAGAPTKTSGSPPRTRKGADERTSARRPNPLAGAARGASARTKKAAGAGRAPQRAAKGPARALKRTKRQTPCQQGEELDDYVDQLFRFGTRIVRAMEPITLPNATIELPDYNLQIFLYEGKGTRAYKFRRTKPAWVFCSNETISLGITIEVEELRVAYKYRVISGSRLLFDGDLEARLSPKVQAQFSQAVQEEDSEEPVQQRIDRVRVFRLGRVFVLIRGLGNLTQSLSMLINSYLNDNQEELQPTFRMVEGDAVRLLNRALANVNVPLLSVV